MATMQSAKEPADHIRTSELRLHMQQRRGDGRSRFCANLRPLTSSARLSTEWLFSTPRRTVSATSSSNAASSST